MDNPNTNVPMKPCKHCKTMIPKGAKVCPNCRKKQGGITKWIVIAIVVIIIIAIASSASGGKDEKVKKTSSSGNSSSTTESGGGTEEYTNKFNVGDVAETDDLKITFISAEKWKSDNEFTKPKDGCEFWRFELKFENKSDEDQHLSTMVNWECYADDKKVDQSWAGDDSQQLDATLSAGRSAQGALYFEVPKEAKSIELEYDINFWGSDKIVFVGK